MPRVLVTPTQIRQRPGRYSELLKDAGFEVIWPEHGQNTMQRNTLLELLAGADAMLASTEPMTRDVLAASSLRVVARLGVGYDSVDVPAATDLNFVVTTTPGAVDESVAEHTMAMLLALTRDVVGRDRQARQGRWERKARPRLAGKTFGIIGLGRIGKAVALRAAGMQMRVIAHDPVADEQFAVDHQIKLCSFGELLSTADIVSVHAPFSPATADLINAETLDQMKQGAIVVNTSRGGLVDEHALCDALRQGRLCGAALDVFKTEPLPTDHPLLSLDNVVVCTHMGGLDEQSEEDMSRMAAECVVELHQGRWPEGRVVNPQLRSGWKWRASEPQ